jgi:hypothetical protein
MKESQENKILEYLKKHGSITPKDAYKEFDCMRLAAQIFNLKQQGINIQTTIEKSKNNHGRTVCYARYFLCE